MDVELLTQRAVESLVEDEALRGPLTDQGYEPVLNWAMDRLLHCAREVAADPDPQPLLQACVARLRQILRGVANAAERRDASLVASALGPPVFDAAEASAVRQELARLSLTEDPDENATLIVQSLSAPWEDDR